jgi:integrase
MRPTWRPSTADVVERSVTHHIVPAFGNRPLGSLKRVDVEAWAAALQLAPGTVATVRQHLEQILTAAVEDGLLPRNPAAGARLPRIEEVRAKPVACEVLDAITEAAPAWMRIAVPLAAALGLCQSEAARLSVDRVDFLRRTVTVDRQLLTPKSGPLVFAPPKTASSYRVIPLPTFVGEAIAAHLAEHGAGEHGLILHQANMTAMSRHRFGVTWRAATTSAGASGVRYHDLRHTFASTLLSNGVSIKAVADWLGHSSPTITLSTYAHLMPVDEDRARAVLQGAFARRAEDQLRTSAV